MCVLGSHSRPLLSSHQTLEHWDSSESLSLSVWNTSSRLPDLVLRQSDSPVLLAVQLSCACTSHSLCVLWILLSPQSSGVYCLSQRRTRQKRWKSSPNKRANMTNPIQRPKPKRGNRTTILCMLYVSIIFPEWPTSKKICRNEDDLKQKTYPYPKESTQLCTELRRTPQFDARQDKKDT